MWQIAKTNISSLAEALKENESLVTLGMAANKLTDRDANEIAHALADHGNERMSQGLIAQLGLSALDVALSNKPAETRNLLMSAAGAGAQVGVLLPFSRKHESEADEIGLYLTAMAGYKPAEAVPFWERMNKKGGSRPPAFLSTHPDPKKRSETLNALLPKARAYGIKYPATGSSKYKK